MAIAINLGGHGKRWELDLSAVPVERVQSGGRAFGVFLIVFALIWGGAPVFGLVSELQAGRYGPEILLFLIFPVVGVAVLLFGLHSLMWHRRIAFDGKVFTVAESGLKGTRRWSEPLSAYQGVMRHTRRVRTKNSSYTLYMIDLVHPDAARKINLYTARTERGFREKWESFARRLGLPALEMGEGGMVRREAEDLDKSAAQLVAEGKVEIDRDALLQPGDAISVRHEGDTVVLTRTRPVNPWWGWLLALLFPLVFVGVAIYAPDMPSPARLVLGAVGAVLEIAFAIGVATDLLSRQRLRVGPDGVQVNRAYARRETAGKSLASPEIETVMLAAKSDGARPALTIAGDRESLRFGRGLPRRSLDFALNTVLSKISESRRRRQR